MELTKEHFDQVLTTLATKEDLKTLATKDDLAKEIADVKADLTSEIAPLKVQLDSIEAKVDRLSTRSSEDNTATLKDVVKLKGRVKNLEKEVEQLKLKQAA